MESIFWGLLRLELFQFDFVANLTSLHRMCASNTVARRLSVSAYAHKCVRRITAGYRSEVLPKRFLTTQFIEEIKKK